LPSRSAFSTPGHAPTVGTERQPSLAVPGSAIFRRDCLQGRARLPTLDLSYGEQRIASAVLPVRLN
jgi:hypothetical protein